MSDAEPIFKNSKVGDRFYSLTFGYCIVKKIYDSSINIYPIVALPDDPATGTISLTLDGYHSFGSKTRDAYWSKPEIIERVPKIASEDKQGCGNCQYPFYYQRRYNRWK